MSDFDDLRQIREAKENAEVRARQQAAEEQRRQSVKYDLLWSRMKQGAKDIHDTVMLVLTELKAAAYPSLSIKGPELMEGGGTTYACWYIVREAYDNEGDSFPYSVVEVRLEFSENGEAFRLLCYRAPILVDDVVPQPRSMKSRLFRNQDIVRASSHWTTVHFEPVSCSLDRDELVHSLRILHPDHTINARLAPGSDRHCRS